MIGALAFFLDLSQLFANRLVDTVILAEGFHCKKKLLNTT